MNMARIFSECQFPSKGVILLLETWILQSQQRGLLLVLTPPSKLGVGSALTDMGLCCLKPFGFQAGNILLGFSDVGLGSK